MFSKLIRKNGKENYKENGIYFLSLVISIVAFYVILSLEKQDVMLFLEKMESDAVARLFFMIKGVYGVSLFMIFFMIYFAQRYQLQRRNHEFGMLMMLGMPRGKLFGMLMVEDLYTSGISLIIGLPVAVVLSEGISLITAKLVGMGIIGHRFSFSVQAALATAVGFFAIKLLANVLLSAKIVKQEPGGLMREQVEQTYKRISWPKELVGVLTGSVCLVAAYVIALTQGIIFYQLKWMAIVIVLGIFGTYWVIKGICLMVRFVLSHGKKRAELHTFTFRQLQENVFGKCMPLTIASLLVLMSVVCMAYGIAVSVSQAQSYEHGMDYTFTSYDEESAGRIRQLAQDASVQDVIGDWIPVKVAILPIRQMYGDESMAPEGAVSYDTSEVMACADQLNEEDWEAFYMTLFYYGVYEDSSSYMSAPYLIPLSDWNALQQAKGKDRLTLGENEIALYMDPEFINEGIAPVYSKILEKNPAILVDGKPYSFVNTLCSDDIVVDRSITIGYGLVVPDSFFNIYAGSNNMETYWNAYLKSELIEKNGLMQAIQIGNKVFDAKGIAYENYLQNMGRQLFYIVAASYLTIYFAIVFLLIANTVISLQFLMQEKKTGNRYRTLIRLGSRYDHLCKSAKTQITCFFAMPVGLALVSGVVGTMVLFRTMLPGILQGKIMVLIWIAGAVILMLAMIECVYMWQVIKASRQNMNQMFELVREDS